MLDARELAGSKVTFADLLYINGGHLQLHKVRKTYSFGCPRHVARDEMNVIIQQMFYVPDERDPNNFRNIVLVGRGSSNDLATLRRRGLEVLDINTIVANFDTLYMSNMILGRWASLMSFVDDLKIPYAKLHNAGDDARFTLQALLMLAHVSAENLAG